MRALVQETYGPVDNLRWAERDKPTPAANAVLIRVRAAGVDPGIWHVMTGRPYMVRLMGFGFSGPKSQIAGWDASGVVEAVGSAVTRFKPGDEVLGASPPCARIVGGAIRSLFSSQKLATVTAKVKTADLLVLKEMVEAGKLKPLIGR
jgi:NADPH:quinone reductase-like Zn-dependent oxidoreductase